MTGAAVPKPRRAVSVLWFEAAAEHPTDEQARRQRFHELMVEEGHIVTADHSDAGVRAPFHDYFLCGWPGGSW